MRRMHCWIAVVVASLLVAPAMGAVMTFVAPSTTFDDVYIAAAIPNSNNGNEDNLLRPNYTGLLAIKDLFTLLPPTQDADQEIVIDSATLKLTSSGQTNVTIYPITTDWLTKPAGESEMNVTWNNRDVENNLSWASGGAFSSADYDTNVVVTGQTTSTYNGSTDFDVTNIIQHIYSTGNNYGMVINGGVYIRSSEHTTASYRPSLTIEYHYEAVPEPGALSLLGLAGLALLRRR